MTHDPSPLTHLLDAPIRELDPPLLAPVADEVESAGYGTMIALGISALMMVMMVLALVYVVMHPAEGHHIQQCY